jgi:hypothetical protein
MEARRSALRDAAFQFHRSTIAVNGCLNKKAVISDSRVDVGNVL